MNLWYQKKALKQNAQRLGNIVGWITIITALSMVIIMENMALENAQRACELSHWEEWLFVSTLAAAYAELGQFEEAIRYQKKAIAMNKNPEERDRRGQQERLNLYETAQPFRDPEVSQ